MPDVSVPAVLVAAIAAFVSSGAWYAVLGSQLAAARGAGATDETTKLLIVAVIVSVWR